MIKQATACLPIPSLHTEKKKRTGNEDTHLHRDLPDCFWNMFRVWWPVETVVNKQLLVANTKSVLSGPPLSHDDKSIKFDPNHPVQFWHLSNQQIYESFVWQGSGGVHAAANLGVDHVQNRRRVAFRADIVLPSEYFKECRRI